MTTWNFLGPLMEELSTGKDKAGHQTARSSGPREVTKQIWRDVWLMKFVHYFHLHPANNGRYVWLAYQAK